MTHALPKVSIVIPVHNGGDYLAEAIDSALAQTYRDIEVLVVNDGSNDGGETERVALSYGARVRYFCKPNGGVASALNRGIDEMSGDYFSWLSHDDLYAKDKIEKEMAVLARVGLDNVIVYSDYSVFTADPDHAVPVKMKGVKPEEFRYWITVENRLHGCTLLIPRRAFEKVGRFKENLRTTQDYDLWFRMATEFSFIHMPETLVQYRSHRDQGTRKMAGLALAECNALFTNFLHDLSPEEVIDGTGKSLAAAYAEIASSMFDRGFNEAGRIAEQLVTEFDEQGGHKVTLPIRRTYGRLKNHLRRLLPVRVKQTIKSALRIVKQERLAAVKPKD